MTSGIIGVTSGWNSARIPRDGASRPAVKFASALGADVTVFTTSPEKTNGAKRHTFDFALDTVPCKHDLNRFIPLLERDATYCRVGVGKIEDSNEIGQMNLVLYRNALAGSNTGWRRAPAASRTSTVAGMRKTVPCMDGS